MIFQRFPTTFRRFPKILQKLSEGLTNVAKHFPKIPEDYRRLPKTFEEDPKIFRSFTNEKYNLRDKLDISESIDILISEDMENTPLESRMWFHMNFTSGVFSSKTLMSIINRGYYMVARRYEFYARVARTISHE